MVERKKTSDPWEARHSLSEILVEAKEGFNVPADANILDVYTHLFEKHFGWVPRVKLDGPNARWFRSVVEFCAREEVDPRIYVTAQMHGMKSWLSKHKKVIFSPNMLSPGPKARGRYNVYVRWAQRRFARTTFDVFDGQTAVGRLRDTVVAEEERVARHYCAARVAGEELTWEAAVAVEKPLVEWVTVYADLDAPKAQDHEIFKRALVLQRRHGPEFLPKVRRLAQLGAAVAIAETYAHGLADRLGLRGPFSWEAFARLLCRLFPRQKSERVPLTGDVGRRWGAPNA